jgi:drug/metabolite transporter (DMT)-like permease
VIEAERGKAGRILVTNLEPPSPELIQRRVHVDGVPKHGEICPDSPSVSGALYATAAVSMWAGWVVAARLGVQTSLTPWDITAIRFGVAGVILLPYLLKNGLAIDRLGGWGVAAIMVGGGAPMVLVSYIGLLFAPARHASSLYTGLLPLNVAIMAALVLGEAFTVAKRIGLAFILPGVLGIVWGAGATIGSPQNIGHALFIGAGIMSAGYFVAMRKGRLSGLHAGAIAAVGSLVAYVPIYVMATGASLASAPWRDVAPQALVQGLLTSVVSQVLFGRAVGILGASRAAAFAALAPAITALLAIPILGEWPATSDWIAILLISCGVYFVSGGPLVMRRAVKPAVLSQLPGWRSSRGTVEGFATRKRPSTPSEYCTATMKEADACHPPRSDR